MIYLHLKYEQYTYLDVFEGINKQMIFSIFVDKSTNADLSITNSLI